MAENTLSFLWLIAVLVLPVVLLVRGFVAGGWLIATLEGRGPCTRVERRPGCGCNHCRGRCLCASRAAARMRAGGTREELQRVDRQHAEHASIRVPQEAELREQAPADDESIRLDREAGDVRADVAGRLWWDELLRLPPAHEYELRAARRSRLDEDASLVDGDHLSLRRLGSLDFLRASVGEVPTEPAASEDVVMSGDEQALPPVSFRDPGHLVAVRRHR